MTLIKAIETDCWIWYILRAKRILFLDCMEGSIVKDYKLMKKRGLNLALLHEVVSMLANNESLPDKYKDHYLIGEYKRI